MISSRKIYVASSWRNSYQQGVVQALRGAGYEVYDFKNPTEGDSGFSWSSIDPNWKNWTVQKYTRALKHPLAEKGFEHDMGAMEWADTCVMVLPCGRSAHTEMGWFTGKGKRTIIYCPEQHTEPELMYKQADIVLWTMEGVLDWLRLGYR